MNLTLPPHAQIATQLKFTRPGFKVEESSDGKSSDGRCLILFVIFLVFRFTVDPAHMYLSPTLSASRSF
jgi:hypothetical protein